MVNVILHPQYDWFSGQQTPDMKHRTDIFMGTSIDLPWVLLVNMKNMLLLLLLTIILVMVMDHCYHRLR